MSNPAYLLPTPPDALNRNHRTLVRLVYSTLQDSRHRGTSFPVHPSDIPAGGAGAAAARYVSGVSLRGFIDLNQTFHGKQYLRQAEIIQPLHAAYIVIYTEYAISGSPQ